MEEVIKVEHLSKSYRKKQVVDNLSLSVKEGSIFGLLGANGAGEIPEGFDTMILPEADYLMFQGEPFLEEDYCQAIEQVKEAMNKYNPEIIGYKWDESNPRIQLEPIGKRGYIEMLAVIKK